MIGPADAADKDQRLSDATSLYVVDQIMFFQELLTVVCLDKQFKRVSENLWLVIVCQLILLSKLSVSNLRLRVALSALLLIILHVLSSEEQIVLSKLLYTEFERVNQAFLCLSK